LAVLELSVLELSATSTEEISVTDVSRSTCCVSTGSGRDQTRSDSLEISGRAFST
jgi:hypothetical protein